MSEKIIDPIKFTIQPRSQSTYLAWLIIDCEHSAEGACRFGLWDRPAAGQTMWQWNGSFEKPTITPSINCHGRCNRHFTITDGVAT